MATATTRPTDPPPPHVQRPLERLSSTIRAYVLIDAVLTVGLFLAVWFWAGLLLDFGVFRLTAQDWWLGHGPTSLQALDWVQVLPAALRVVILVAVVGLLAFLLVKGPLLRLTREFSPRALALVLERRFPGLLGDRLITAVELSDLRLAREYGYSEAMVNLTVREADERVGQVTLKQVFNWRRLWKRGAALLALLVVPIPVAAGLYDLSSPSPSLTEWLYRSRDVASIWFERNVLLANTIWPRRAHLEVVRPAETDIRLGQDTAVPRLLVRSVKWVRGDRHAPGGWRALTWADLRESPALLGEEAPPLPIDLFATVAKLPPSTPTTEADWTVDRVESLLLENPAFRQASYQQDSRLAAVRTVLEDKLVARAADPSMYRKLRKVEVPDRLELIYSGPNTSGVAPLERIPGPDNDFEGTVTDLKESVRFFVRGLDFFTDTRKITFLPPPRLTNLTRDELQPAYLYHRPPPDDAAWLKGKQQQFLARGVSLTGPVSVFSVPARTEVVLHGESDKPLAAVTLRPRARKGEEVASGPLPAAVIEPDGQHFSAHFPPLTRGVEFECELSDQDQVSSHRPVRIEVVEDRSPEVDVLVEVIRRSERRGGLVCTPSAMIPISGKVLDDYGLARAEYVYSLQVEDKNRTANEAAIGTSVLHALATTTPLGSLSPGLMLAARLGSRAKEGPVVGTPVPLKTFAQRLALESQNDPGRAQLEQLFRQNLNDSRQIRLHELKPDWVYREQPLEYFDLQEARPDLKVSSGNQPTYRLLLTVQATDTNIETEPGTGRTGRNKETFSIEVIPEPELRIEIGEDQDKLSKKMREVKATLDDAGNKLIVLADTAPRYDPVRNEIDFATAAVRAEEVARNVSRSRIVVQGILADYSRLLKEMQLNRMDPTVIDRVRFTVVAPLEAVLRKNAEFERTEARTAELQTTMAEKRTPSKQLADQAVQEMSQLLAKLQAIIDAMGIVFDRQQAIEILVRMRKGVGQSRAMLETLRNLSGLEFEDFTRPVVRALPTQLTLSPGKATRVTFQRIDRDAGKEIALRLQVPADSGLKVPATAVIAKGATEVSFEVTAGPKTGDFSLQAVPREGAPVRVKVAVK
jgi:hypothetical protein